MKTTSAALRFNISTECKITKARSAVMKLPHYDVKTPVFMPVGTQVMFKTKYYLHYIY